MRGGSHGDWNRFLCSQILGAERDTMLLTSRQPSVSSSNPTKTTPGEVLPGGVAVAVAASPGNLLEGVPGLRTPGWGTRPAPRPGDHWRQSPGGRRRSRSLEGGFQGSLLARPARRPSTRSGPLGERAAERGTSG